MSDKIYLKSVIPIQKKLVEIRKSLNITQAELGERINKPQQYISRFEKCDGHSTEGIWLIADVLGYDLVLSKKISE